MKNIRVPYVQARHDPFLTKVLEIADTQRFIVNKGQEFDNGGFCFHSWHSMQVGLVVAGCPSWEETLKQQQLLQMQEFNVQ